MLIKLDIIPLYEGYNDTIYINPSSILLIEEITEKIAEDTEKEFFLSPPHPISGKKTVDSAFIIGKAKLLLDFGAGPAIILTTMTINQVLKLMPKTVNL